MFESRTPAGVAWSYDMEGHAQQCVQRCCELESLKSLLGWSPFQEREELESVGELAKVCSQIALKCLYFARIGRPDVLWSANKLARSVTKLTHWESGRHSTWCDLVSKNPHSATASQNCGTSGPKSLENLEDPVVPLERNLCGHPLAWLVRERQFEEVLLELGWKEGTELGMSIYSPNTMIIFVSVCGSHQKDWKKAESESHVGRNWRSWLILENQQYYFLTMYIWDVLNVNANRTKTLLRNTERCSDHEWISTVATEK